MNWNELKEMKISEKEIEGLEKEQIEKLELQNLILHSLSIKMLEATLRTKAMVDSDFVKTMPLEETWIKSIQNMPELDGYGLHYLREGDKSDHVAFLPYSKVYVS